MPEEEKYRPTPYSESPHRYVKDARRRQRLDALSEILKEHGPEMDQRVRTHLACKIIDSLWFKAEESGQPIIEPRLLEMAATEIETLRTKVQEQREAWGRTEEELTDTRRERNQLQRALETVEAELGKARRDLLEAYRDQATELLDSDPAAPAPTDWDPYREHMRRMRRAKQRSKK